MRAAVLGAIVAVAALPATAGAHSAYSPVQVVLAIDNACKIQTPNQVTASALPQLAATENVGVASMLADCRTGVRPLFSLANDFAEGAYVATIDF